MKTNLLTKGYHKIRDEEMFKFIDINEVQWSLQGTIPLQMAVRTPELEMKLYQTQLLLATTYLKTCKADYVDLVKGMDDNVYDWHNDFEPHKVNLGILLYYTEIDEETGGAIEFRKLGSTEVETLYPKQYDILIINHTENFEHRVTKQKIKVPRIVGSYHYWVDYDSIH
jgi:hypothetical protein